MTQHNQSNFAKLASVSRNAIMKAIKSGKLVKLGTVRTMIAIEEIKNDVEFKRWLSTILDMIFCNDIYKGCCGCEHENTYFKTCIDTPLDNIKIIMQCIESINKLHLENDGKYYVVIFYYVDVKGNGIDKHIGSLKNSSMLELLLRALYFIYKENIN